MVADRPVVVAADLARVTRCGGDAGEGRQCVRGVELVQVAADGSEELGAEGRTDAGDAQKDVGKFVLAKPALDELVRLGDLLIEVITFSARVRTSWAMVFSPGTAVCCRSAASTADSAKALALRTLRLASHFVSRGIPARRIEAGVW